MIETLLVAGLIAVLLFVSLVILGVVSLNITHNVSGFVAASDGVSLTDNEGIIASPASVLAAQPGVLTTHTTNTTGSLTMTNASHGIITGQRIDIYWTGGQCYGAVAGTVAGAVVPIASVSGGSNLPASSTAVTVGIPLQTTFSLTGNNLTALVLSTPQNGYFVFDASSSDVLAEYVVGGRVFTWDTTAPAANPLAGLVPTSVWMSHSYVSGPVTTMQAAAITH
jgi:hypothetical protein